MTVKIKLMSDFDINNVDGCDYTFINFASIGAIYSGLYSSNSFKYMADGVATSLLLSLLCFKKIKRKSFDFTSIADRVFAYATSKSLKVVVIGGSADHSSAFCEKIIARYSSELHLVCLNGYFDNQKKIVSEVLSMNPDIVIAGLGAGKQELFLASLRESGYKGIGYTCGGFISQTAMSNGVEYYPPLFDRLNIRFAYRMYREPHTIKRYLFDYPKNVILLLVKVLKRDLTVEVV